MPNILNLPLSLKPDSVHSYLGLKDTAPSPELKRLINHYINEAMRLSTPRGTWQTFNIKKREPETVLLENSPLVIRGKSAAAHFLTSAKATLLAATLGARLGSYLEELSLSQPGHALILDGIASAAVEQITDELDLMIARDIQRQGYFPTARFSPGYGSWPLNSQKEFLESLRAENIGLSITPYYLLQPVKSVTAAIGWSRIPVPRDYAGPQDTKPCQGPLTCSNCPISSTCPSKSEI